MLKNTFQRLSQQCLQLDWYSYMCWNISCRLWVSLQCALLSLFMKLHALLLKFGHVSVLVAGLDAFCNLLSPRWFIAESHFYERECARLKGRCGSRAWEAWIKSQKKEGGQGGNTATEGTVCLYFLADQHPWWLCSRPLSKPQFISCQCLSTVFPPTNPVSLAQD